MIKYHRDLKTNHNVRVQTDLVDTVQVRWYYSARDAGGESDQKELRHGEGNFASHFWLSLLLVVVVIDAYRQLPRAGD